MRSGRTLHVLGLALLISAAGGACGDDDLPPRNPLNPTSPTPTVFTTRISVAGPTTAAIGEETVYTATALMSDGTTHDAAADVTWRTNPNLLDMTAPGRFVGKAGGDAFVTITLGRLTSTISSVIVVPKGTFRLNGTVKDEGAPVRDATIFIDNQALGRRTIESPDGTYRVFGVAGLTRLSVSKPGYATNTSDLTITDHQRVDVDMKLSAPRDNIAGRYNLRITAPERCANLNEYRERRYEAVVEQNGPSLTVSLSGAAFVSNRGATQNRFTGQMQALDAIFSMRDNYFYYYPYPGYYPDIYEEVSKEVFVGISGRAQAKVTAAGLSGRLAGNFVVVDHRFQFIAKCSATDIEWVMTR